MGAGGDVGVLWVCKKLDVLRYTKKKDVSPRR